MIYQNPLFWAGLLFLGGLAGYFLRTAIVSKNLNSAEQKIKKQIDDSKSKAQEVIFEAQEKAASLLEEVKKAEKEGKIQLGRLEERLLKKEEHLDSQSSEIKQREEKLVQDVEKIKAAQQSVEELKEKTLNDLEKISGLSTGQAKDLLMKG